MDKIMKKISFVLEVLTVICFLVLAGLIYLQISGRWIGINNLGWTDEMVSCFTSWMVFLGYAYMCERDEHICISMLQDAVPQSIKNVMLLVVRIVNILCGMGIFYSGMMWTRSTASKLTSVLQINYNIWYSSIWICSVLYTVFAAVKLVQTISKLFSKKR